MMLCFSGAGSDAKDASCSDCEDFQGAPQLGLAKMAASEAARLNGGQKIWYCVNWDAEEIKGSSSRDLRCHGQVSGKCVLDMQLSCHPKMTLDFVLEQEYKLLFAADSTCLRMADACDHC